jgi:transcriptional regulator with XRE-family HTH domain
VIILSDFLKLVGDRLRMIRKANGLTQEEVAEKAGLQYTYIGGVERGERNISLETLEKIISALGVSPVDVFNFHEIEILENLVSKKKFLENNILYLLKGRSEEEIISLQKILKEILSMNDSKKQE